MFEEGFPRRIAHRQSPWWCECAPNIRYCTLNECILVAARGHDVLSRGRCMLLLELTYQVWLSADLLDEQYSTRLTPGYMKAAAKAYYCRRVARAIPG